jgi:hypothetical protein
MPRNPKSKALMAKDILPQLGLGGPERKMRFIDSVRNSLFAPFHFFESLAKSPGLDGAINYLLTLALFPSLYGTISYFLVSGDIAASLQMGITEYAFIIFLSCVSVAVTHLLVKLFGGKGKMTMTFKTAVYGGTPWYLFASIPIAALFGLVWSIYLEALGLTKTQKLNWILAGLAVVFPIVLGFALIVWMVMQNPEALAVLAATSP